MDENLILKKDYSIVRIIPMNQNEEEPRINGKPGERVKKDFFENQLLKRENNIYYYHGNMLEFNNEPVFAMFQYGGKIIACGWIMDRIKVSDNRYIEPINDTFPYDGMLILENVFALEDINVFELNQTLKAPINSFSNVFYKLDVYEDKFKELLLSKRMEYKTKHNEY